MLRTALMQKQGVKMKIPGQLAVILAGFFFVNFGANMVIPFFGVYLTEFMSLTPAQAGIVMTVTVGTPRAMALFGGTVADRFGVRASMTTGLIILIGSAVGYAFADSLTGFVLFAFLSGIGYSLFTPAGKAAVSAYAPEGTKVKAFAVRNLCVNAGAAAGPFVGMLLTVNQLPVTFLLTAGVYAVFLLIVIMVLPRGETQRRRNTEPVGQIPSMTDDKGPGQSQGMFRSLLFVFRDVRMLRFALIIIAYYVMMAIFSLVLPLYLAERYQTQDGVGLLFIGNAVMLIALQYPALVWLARRFKARGIALTGCMLTIAAITTVGIIGCSYGFAALTVVLFTFGQLMIMPAIDTVISDMAPTGREAVYQGFCGLAGAAGGAAGNLLGGALYGYASAHHFIPYAWPLFGIFGLVLVTAYCRWESGKD